METLENEFLTKLKFRPLSWFKQFLLIAYYVPWNYCLTFVGKQVSDSVESFDLFLHVLLHFQESVASPAAQQGADGDKAGDQRRLDTDTTATAQNLEKGNAAQSKETGVVFGALHLYCLL